MVSAINADPDPDPFLRSSPSSAHRTNQAFLWKNLFSESPAPPSPQSSTTYLEDSTPVVLAPSSVLFKSSEAWSGYLVCHFFGDAPSSAKIYSDLNPVWGRNGSISVRRFSNGSCLIHVPSARTKQWILDNGLWSSGTVSFAVSEWSSVPSLAPKKLTSASTILTFREVPPQLWSQIGIETIAGGIAKLIPNVKASLPLSSLGTATIRAIVPLGSALPSTVIIKDSQGATVRIHVSYGRLPPLCPSCQTFGHQSHRCPSQRLKKTTPTPAITTVPSSTTSMDIDDHIGSEPQIPNLNSPSTDETITGPPTTISTSQVPSSSAQLLVHTHPLVKAPTSEASGTVVDTSSSSSLAIPVSSRSEPNIDKAPNTEVSVTAVDISPSSPLANPVSLSEPVIDKAGSQLTESSDIMSIITTPMVSDPVILNEDEKSGTLAANGDIDTNSTIITSMVSDNTVPFSFPPLANSLVDGGIRKARDLSIDSLPFVLPTDDDTSSLSSSSSMQSERVLNTGIDEVQVHKDVLLDQSLDALDASDRKKVIKEKRKKQSTLHTALSCIQERHKFKPKGIIEKRKSKIHQLQLPDEEEIQDAFQEMKKDKTESCIYELLATHKIMKNLNSEIEDNTRQLKT